MINSPPFQNSPNLGNQSISIYKQESRYHGTAGVTDTRKEYRRGYEDQLHGLMVMKMESRVDRGKREEECVSNGHSQLRTA